MQKLHQLKMSGVMPQVPNIPNLGRQKPIPRTEFICKTKFNKTVFASHTIPFWRRKRVRLIRELEKKLELGQV